MNYKSDTRSFQRTLLDEALLKGIERNEEQRKTWANYKNGHLKVTEALHTFPRHCSMNCMVPIGKHAFVKGKLIHTNEVLASLGDGYFAKYSAPMAIALCERRIEQADEVLQRLSAERDLYETRMTLLEDDAFGDCAGEEILEHWNENQIEEWKAQHREREREYHQKQHKLRQEEKKKIETEEDLFQRLDELEIEEELADEINRLEDAGYEICEDDLAENSCYYESENTSENEEEDDGCDKKEQTDDVEDKLLKAHVENSGRKKSVSFIDTTCDENKEEPERKTNENASGGREESTEEIIKIEFSHSHNDLITKEIGEHIETPGDIYRIFSKPKSILKRSPNDNPSEPVELPNYSIESEEDYVKASTYEVVMKDIKERDTTAIINVSEAENKARPISKFKKERGLKK